MSGIALQLYTMRAPAKKDLVGTLKRIREIGWEYVQWSGMPALPANEIRAALDAAGLKAIAAHCDMESFEKDFAAAVQFWKTVGALDVAPGGMMADCCGSLEAWLRGAKRLDTIGAKLREVGMRLSYHNHDTEFGTFEGDARRMLDILYASTGPANLFAELDTAWVYAGGADPAEYIQKYTKRCPVIHVKDLAVEKRDGRVWFVPLGEGILRWPSIFQAGKEAGVEWYVYEQDTCDGDPMDSARISFEFLKKNT